LELNKITINGLVFEEYINNQLINTRIDELAKVIQKDFAKKELQDDKPLLILVLMNGAFMFASDLVRKFDFNVELNFLKISSYQDLDSTGNVIMDLTSFPDVKGRDILIVEDILDTGTTLNYLINHLEGLSCKSIKIACLLVKPKKVQFDVKINYIAFEIEDDFVVGYGLDYKGIGRNFPDIYQLSDNAI
jgi:hypoxanthine phosphoribosyltransferase